MADISILSRLVNGYQRNVDVSQNALVVGSIKIGSSTPVEITKAIATKLIAINAAADADGTYDTRYNTKSQLASTSTGQGASLVGIEDAGAYYTGDTVEEALAELGAAMGTGDASGISYDPTASGLTATNVQDAIDEVEDRVDATEIVANAAIPATEKGAALGVATLDAGGKVPVSQLPNSIMEYKGTYNASTNSPTLIDGTGNTGDVYRVTVAGSQDFGSGSISFAVGDYVIYNGATWEKADATDAVTSVNGLQGVVVLTTDDVGEGTTNKYFTDERAQDAIGGILIDTTTIDLTYNDGTNELSADVRDNSIGNNHLTTGVADQITITGGNGSALAVQNAPKVQTSELAGESLAATTIFAMRFGRAADAGFVAGRMYKADRDSSSVDNFDVQGLCRPASGVSAGDPFDLVSEGDLSAPSHGFTVGEPLWLNTAGSLTQTAPNGTLNEAVVKVGTVKDANTIRVKIQIISAG